MPYATSGDVKLFYQETGSGTPIVFMHEFAGDYRRFEPQVRYFSRQYRCIRFSARGYLPSDVPESLSQYGVNEAVKDTLAILDHLKIGKAHVVGFSMGAYTTLHLLLRHPDRVLSAVIAGCGAGSEPHLLSQFREKAEQNAKRFESLGMREAVRELASAGYRRQLKSKNPRAWQELMEQFSELSDVGAARIQRGVLKTRPPIPELVDEMSKITVPTFIIVGDDDQPCIGPSILMRKTISSAVLWVVPDTGHTLDLEEPERINTEVHLFLSSVNAGTWRKHTAER